MWSVNTHICSSLDCKDVDIHEGKCKGKHKSWQYGVCMCDDGFVEKDGVCVSSAERKTIIRFTK